MKRNISIASKGRFERTREKNPRCVFRNNCA